MHTWTNTATNPSRLELRSDRALQYVMTKMNIPDCGLAKLRSGINDDWPLPFNVNSSHGEAGLWTFHPVMEMSYKNKFGDYVTTTVPAKDVRAKGKYIPITCGAKRVDVVYFPKCGNIATVVKQQPQLSTVVIEQIHNVPIASTITLLLLGIYLLRRFKRAH